MKNIFLSAVIVLIFTKLLFSQTFTEKKLFTLEFEGSPDVYSFIYDKNSGMYCYGYMVPNENKVFLISNKSLSVKYDYINYSDILFDSKGNYFAVCGNYQEDYGADNNFVILNGKEVFNSNYVESYSSYIDNSGNFNFIFREKGLYYFGKINSEGKLSKSQGYDLIKPLYSDSVNYLNEGDAEGFQSRKYFYTENGNRGFITVRNGKTSLIAGDKEINTNYTDINETSVTKNKNGKLSFIAKTNGIFFASPGEEFVVSGDSEYRHFFITYPPVLFDENNEPVYIAADSLGENKMDYYAVTGNKKHSAFMSGNELKFSSSITNLKIVNGNNLSYTGIEEVVIPNDNSDTGKSGYNYYFYKYYLITGETAHELGYNLSEIKYGKDNKLLYTGIADLTKKEYLLMESNGESRVIINDKNFDAIYYFGYTPSGEIYYSGEVFADSASGKNNSSSLYLGNRLIGSFDFIMSQGINNDYSALKFDSKGNYAFAAGVETGDEQSAEIYLNGKKLPAPDKTPVGSNKLNTVLNMIFTVNNKLFFIGEFKSGKDDYVYQCYSDNSAVGESFDSIGNVTYDKNKDTISFFGVRGKSLYSVNIGF